MSRAIDISQNEMTLLFYVSSIFPFVYTALELFTHAFLF